MKEYESLLRYRDEPIEDITPWLWIAADSGCWDGPKQDWITSHSLKWLSRVTDWTACVQAGGAQGMYPRLLSTRFRTVYTFEPDTLSFHCLVNNCQSDNIIKINAALGESHDLIRVRRDHPSNVGMNSVTLDGEVHIPQFRIDDLNLPKCGLIALDLEGHEPYAIRGAKATIVRCRPVITIENGHTCETILRELGYRAADQSVADKVFIPN